MFKKYFSRKAEIRLLEEVSNIDNKLDKEIARVQVLEQELQKLINIVAGRTNKDLEQLDSKIITEVVPLVIKNAKKVSESCPTAKKIKAQKTEVTKTPAKKAATVRKPKTVK